MTKLIYIAGTLPHKHKVVIAGNHDTSFDLDLIKHKRKSWQWQLTKENYEDRLALYGVDSVHGLLTNCVYLQDSLIEIDGVKIYGSPWLVYTVKFLNFGMPEIFAVIYLKFKQRPNLKGILSKWCKWNSKQ